MKDVRLYPGDYALQSSRNKKSSSKAYGHLQGHPDVVYKTEARLFTELPGRGIKGAMAVTRGNRNGCHKLILVTTIRGGPDRFTIVAINNLLSFCFLHLTYCLTIFASSLCLCPGHESQRFQPVLYLSLQCCSSSFSDVVFQLFSFPRFYLVVPPDRFSWHGQKITAFFVSA